MLLTYASSGSVPSTVLPGTSSTPSLHLQESGYALISRLYEHASRNTSLASPCAMPEHSQAHKPVSPLRGGPEVHTGSRGCTVCECCHLLDFLSPGTPAGEPVQVQSP